MNYYYITDTGKVRDHNEDSVLIVENGSRECLMAVADGMGGHNAGEVASSIAISHIGERFRKLDTIGTKEDAQNWLRDVVSEINVLIFKYTETHPESKGMGTTLVTAIVTKDFLIYGNIGDSSGFAVKNGKMYKITVDHTLVNLLVKNGELTEEEAKNHPRKNVITRAIGTNSNVDVDVFKVDRHEYKAYLLCTDGLSNDVDEDEIWKKVIKSNDFDKACNELVEMAKARGGKDNITVVVFGGEK